ncbi:hypothetical protein ACQEUX_07410 [Micromonospora sp. CA-259024]|uniref:hypothetical protein n=1 Tax=Micromonospora sp. CA-259024 TaxID=3239965 RepID=UPI003D9277B4
MNPFRRADHAETERLLDSAHTNADTAPDHIRPAMPGEADAASRPARASAPVEPVAGLLAAAAGPVRPGELAGEEAALAAFRAARANPAPSVPPRPRRRRLSTGAVAWIGAMAATATAGAAFAAVTLDQAPDPVAPAPSGTSPTPDEGASPSGDTVEPGRSTPPGTPLSPTGTPSAHTAPVSELLGLCRAWQAKKPEQRERALGTPAFESLVTAAGSADEVGAYCQRLVPEAKPSASAKATPSHPRTGRPIQD